MSLIGVMCRTVCLYIDMVPALSDLTVLLFCLKVSFIKFEREELLKEDANCDAQGVYLKRLQDLAITLNKVSVSSQFIKDLAILLFLYPLFLFILLFLFPLF